MLYSFFKQLTRLALQVYFRKVHIEGTENIPHEGPFLIVANHPSSFLDPISIAVLVKPKISFLAGGFMFKNKIVASILTKFNIIPIYRAQDNPHDLSKNKEVFKGCYDKLSHRGVIMIFPEGTSENERRLRKIKTGAARIALGTSKENDYKLNVKILPVGLNYTKSSRFRSKLFIQFGTPIESMNYIEEYKKDEISTAKKLTNDIEHSIKNLIIDIDKEEYDVLVERVESLFKSELIGQLPVDNQKTFSEIKVSQKIYQAIEYYQKNDADLFHQMKAKIDYYFLNLETLNISDKTIEKGGQAGNILQYFVKSIIILMLGFPIWLFGYINSFIPYRIPRFVALKITDSEAFYGALLMSLGTFSFILFYSLLICLSWIFTHSLIITISYGIALPLSSFFTIFYARIARRFYYNWQFISRFYSAQNLIAQLVTDRNQITKELEVIAERFRSGV